MDILKGLPMDSTFDQDAGFRKMLGLSKGAYPLDSVDMTAATDSIPMSWHREVIRRLLDNEDFASL
jgi:hypothetical protein